MYKKHQTAYFFKSPNVNNLTNSDPFLQLHLILNKMHGHIQSYSVSSPRQILTRQPHPPKPPPSLIDCLDKDKDIQKVQSDPPVYQIANKYTGLYLFVIFVE